MKDTIAFYNTENFFDIFSDSEKQNNEYTPEGGRKWTQKRYENKVGKIASVIGEIGKNESGNPPILIGLAEIENDSVLSDLVKSPHLAEFGYQFIHFDSKDERGIDNALLYRDGFVTILNAEPLHFSFPEGSDHPEDYTRDVLYIQLEINEKILHLFVLHLPSRRDLDVNRDFRNLIMRRIKQKVDEIVEENPDAFVILMGDFNGNPDDRDAQEILKTKKERLLNKGELYNPMFQFKYSSGSLKHAGKWITFDQMLFNNSFFKENSTLNLESVHIYNDRSVQDWDIRYKGSPFRTYAGNKYLGGYSDHFPIYAIINY